MDAGGATDEGVTLRTAKSCGPDASMVGVKLAELSAGDGDKQARSPGRARRKPLTPSRAGMPGDPGATVVTNACAYYTSRTRLRVQRAPGIPRSLLRVAPLPSWGSATPSRGGSFMHNSGASCREIEEACQRHCEERMRRSNPFFLCAARWIASLTLAMTAPWRRHAKISSAGLDKSQDFLILP
jgi:hypothetical protein